MNKRRLILGIGVLLILAGGLLAAFTPGGFLNPGADATLATPLGTINVRESSSRPSAGPIVGYVLLGLGGVALVIGIAMKSPPEL